MWRPVAGDFHSHMYLEKGQYYFDISDTHKGRNSRPVPTWEMRPWQAETVIETLEHTFGDLADKSTLEDAICSASHNAVADNIGDYLFDLHNCKDDSLLEEYDDLNLSLSYTYALETSIAYMLMTRLGLDADRYFSPEDFHHVYEFNTLPTVNALGIAKKGYGDYSGSGYSGYNTTKTLAGLNYRRSYQQKEYGNLQIKIPEVAKIYQRLINEGRYITDKELDAIPDYQRREIADHVRAGFYGATESTPRPFVESDDYWKAVDTIAASLTDRGTAEGILATMKDRRAGMDENERFYEYVVQVEESLSLYLNGEYDLFKGKHPGLTAPQFLGAYEKASEAEGVQPVEKIHEEIEEEKLVMPEAIVPKKAIQAPKFKPLDPEGSNYHITANELGLGTPREKFGRNIEAIKTLQTLETEGRTATSAQQEILAQYVGWGGLADAFDEAKWPNEYARLKNLLSDSEYSAARASTLTAFYTPPIVVKSIYQTLANMGFTTGNILEPACGTGNFMGLLPQTMDGSKLYGVELDSISGRIARQLYPTATVAVRGFEKTSYPDNFFDVAVGNVPFGQFKVPDKK